MSRRLFCLLLLLLAAVAVSQAAKRVRIPDDLRDVTDSEEDEEWKNWGKEKRKPTQRSKMDLSDGKLPTAKQLGRSRYSGVQAIQVKLKKGAVKSVEETRILGTKWTSLLRSGGITENVYAIDTDTLVVQLQDAFETLAPVKKFLFGEELIESLDIKGVRLHPDPDDDDDDDDDDAPPVRPVAWARVPEPVGERGNSGAQSTGGKASVGKRKVGKAAAADVVTAGREGQQKGEL